MENFRKLFFQFLLLVLALVFILVVRFVCESASVGAGTFGDYEKGNVTISQMLSDFKSGGSK